jgi:hypothetical protein
MDFLREFLDGFAGEAHPDAVVVRGARVRLSLRSETRQRRHQG